MNCVNNIKNATLKTYYLLTPRRKRATSIHCFKQRSWKMCPQSMATTIGSLATSRNAIVSWQMAQNTSLLDAFGDGGIASICSSSSATASDMRCGGVIERCSTPSSAIVVNYWRKWRLLIPISAYCGEKGFLRYSTVRRKVLCVLSRQ